MAVGGMTLMFHCYWRDLEQMSSVMIVHALVGTLLIAIFIGQTWVVGTVGMEDAFWAMWRGEMNWNRADGRHDLWLAEIADSAGAAAPAAPETGRPARDGAVEV